MNIGFDAKRIFQNSTGLGNYSRDLVRNLANQYPENKYVLFGKPQKNKSQYHHEFSNSSKYKLVQPKNRNNYPIWRRYGVLNHLQDIDIFHGLTNELPALEKKKIPKTVITIHDLIFKIFPKNYSSIDRQIYNNKVRKGIKIADKVVTISEHTKNDLTRFYAIEESKIEVIPPNIHPIFFAKSSSTATHNLPDNYFLFVSSVLERKNLLGIIEAYRLVVKKLNSKVVVIGKGKSYLKKCKQKIAQYNLEKYFLFLENIETMEELKSIMSKSKGLLYPSFYEGFGIPLVEAMLCKIPILCSNTSSMPSVTNHLATYCNPESYEDIADKLLIFGDTSSVTIAQAYDYAQTSFNKQILTEKLVAIYTNLL